jgi:hypothetical protein
LGIDKKRNKEAGNQRTPPIMQMKKWIVMGGIIGKDEA